MDERQPDNDRLLAYLTALMAPGEPYELAAIGRTGRVRTWAHTSPEALAAAVARLRGDEGYKGLYLIPNPLDPARAGYPHKEASGRRASAAHVARRRVLFIDVDPNASALVGEGGKKIDCPSTDLELEGARLYAEMIADTLALLDWPRPIVVMSGNGYQLLWRWESGNGRAEDVREVQKKGSVTWALDPEPPARQLNARLIEALQLYFADAQVKRGGVQAVDLEGRRALGRIDPADIDASRLCRMPETWNRRGEEATGRAWRAARVVEVPDGWSERALDDGDLEAAIGWLSATTEPAGDLLGPDALEVAQPVKTAPPRVASPAAVELAPIDKVARAILAGEGALGHVEAAVMALPRCDAGTGTYNDWIGVMGALYEALGDAGRDIFVRWSAGNGREDAGAKWDAEAARLASDVPERGLANILRKVTAHTGQLASAWAHARGVKMGERAVVEVEGWEPCYTIEGGASSSTLTAGGERYVFSLDGAVVLIRRVVDDLGAVAYDRQVIAQYLLPIDHYTTLGEAQQTVGVNVQYRGGKGRTVELYSATAGSVESKAAAAGAAKDLAAAGIQVVPGMGSWVVRGLALWGHVAAVHAGREPKRLTSVMGWQPGHRAYVNGCRVFGPDAAHYEVARVAEVRSSNVRVRGLERGGLEAWRAACAEVYDTPALMTSIGLALTGASLEVLGVPTWGVHIYGESSKGKSTALAVAGSVWGYADYEQVGEANDLGNLFNSWKGTEASLERRAAAMSGACMLLDDIGAIDAKLDVPSLIIMVGNGRGKERQHKDWPLMTWKCTLMSSGEQSIAAVARGQIQSGAMARFLDLEFDPHSGDWTRDKAHSDLCKRTARAVYGVAGNAWAELLATRGEARDMLRERQAYAASWLEGQAESLDGTMNRIVSYLASLAATLMTAAHYGIVPWTRDAIFSALRWLLALVEAREVKNQEELAWQRLTRRVLTSGSASEEQWRERVQLGGKYAVQRCEPGRHATYWTTAALLGEAIDALGLKTSTKSLVAWGKACGAIVCGDRQPIGGDRQRWMRLVIEEVGDQDGGDVRRNDGAPSWL